MKVSEIKLETTEGVKLSITVLEARELYYELKNIFEIPIVIEPQIFEMPKVYPISSNKPLTEGSFK